MKRLIIASLFATGLLGAHAQAVAYTDNARVRNVDPQYENISVPRNECHNTWVNEGRQSRAVGPERLYGGAIVGGLAGGVLGHQIGGGSGKDAATALGVVLGAVTGDRLENRNQRGFYDNNQPQARREVQRCSTVYDTQTRVTGYRVAYEYQGQHYTTFMRTNPGNSLQVRVSVDPIER